jgi:C1A family cysteine protease
MAKKSIKIKTNHVYNAHPDLPDFRDFAYEKTAKTTLPTQVDLRSQMPPVYDQGQIGSCTANAWAGAVEYLWIKKKQEFTPSRLFIYYNERLIEGDVKTDGGAQIRDGGKTLATQGVCYESSWPYTKNFATKPSTKCYTAALGHKAQQYSRVNQDSTSIKTALSNGDPVVIGISVYESFESDSAAQTGIIPMPQKSEQLLGGHALLVVGYDDTKQWFIVRNSWGASWGSAGYCFLPYAYLTNSNLASDFWVLQSEL